MEDFNSKYSGEQVEALLDQVASGNAGGGGGGITVETDPVFSASPAASITEEDKEAWNNKVSYSVKDISMVNADGFMTSEGDGFVFPNTPAAQSGHGVVLATLDDIPNEIPIETYLADFTMESLRDGMYNVHQVECDMQALVAAMNANKIILVRESESSDYKGVYVLNGYAEDLLYFSIVDSQGNILYCNGTDYTGLYIDGRDLYFHHWWDKQDTLVSGENIKTINGESIMGSGDITIAGGSGEVGPQGPQGDKGDTGVGVQSVEQTTTSNADGGSNIVTVTLTDGTKSTFTVKNGSKGSNGSNGTNGKDGADGATFTPSVDSAGNLSWTNNKGLTNPPTVNIKGPKGDKGDSGSGGGSSGGVEGGIQWTMRDAEDYIDDNGVIELDPFVVYHNGYFSGDVTILLNGDDDYSEWRIIFYIDAGNSLTINVDCWVNSITPNISAGGMYELSVVFNAGSYYGVIAHFPI